MIHHDTWMQSEQVPFFMIDRKADFFFKIDLLWTKNGRKMTRNGAKVDQNCQKRIEMDFN